MLSVKMRPLTVYDYRAVPEGGPRYQLIEGEMHMAPAPNRFHQHISRNIEFILLKYLEKNPIGEVYDAPFDVELTDINVYQPDIIFVANEHRSLLNEQGLSGAPDFVVEILSPKTAEMDKGTKREVYARCGVEELWIIDPDARRIHVYYLQKNAETPAATYGVKAKFKSRLFPGLTFDTARIFKF